MEVNSVSASSSSAPTPLAGEALDSAETGRDTFLQLLVAQLEHQDPLKPMENTDFTAQLAQFSVLEQIESMNANFGSLLAHQETSSRLQAVSFIGKTVHAEGDTTQVGQGEAAPLRYVLGAESAQVGLDVLNAAGEVVHRLSLVNQSAGSHTVPWHGRDALGNPLPDGDYRFTVTAEDLDGNPVHVETLTQGIVEGVEYEDNRPYLLVGGSRVDLSTVISVREM